MTLSPTWFQCAYRFLYRGPFYKYMTSFEYPRGIYHKFVLLIYFCTSTNSITWRSYQFDTLFDLYINYGACLPIQNTQLSMYIFRQLFWSTNYHCISYNLQLDWPQQAYTVTTYEYVPWSAFLCTLLAIYSSCTFLPCEASLVGCTIYISVGASQSMTFIFSNSIHFKVLFGKFKAVSNQHMCIGLWSQINIDFLVSNFQIFIRITAIKPSQLT